jgi:4-hydroxythreonine-4-phosphate dehydrogenase
MKPILAITMGDPAGIGPEIVVKGLRSRRLWNACRPVVLGRRPALEAAARRLGARIVFDAVGGRMPPAAAGHCPFVETGPDRDPLPPLGRPSAAGGRAALEALSEAICLALDHRVAGIVTAPISKEAIRAAGSPFPGHTEILAAFTGTKRYAMMLVGGPLRVTLATIHEPLARVPALITPRVVRETIALTWEAVRDLGLRQPRIAVCGLNPHAGEAGLMGREERRVIGPADTVFFRAARGEFAAVVAMYHDQGLGPLKTLAFDTGVNVTLGLPIVRTSVDHGTAFDIAGKGVASPASLLAAVELATTLARNRGRN